MKRILALLAFLPMWTFGAAYDVGIDQRPAANNVWEKRLLVSPSSIGVMAYNPVTLLPVWLTLGPGVQVNSGVLDSVAATWATLSGKPTFAPVATSGAYGDLTGAPTIPAAQVPSDWSASTGVSAVLHKPTTLAGYGIADGATTVQLATKFTTPTGTTAQYLRGDGTLGTSPVLAPVATVGTFASLTGKPTTLAGYGITDAPALPAPSVATRALNTAYQVSATRPVFVAYTVDISVVSLLLAGTQGTVTLQYGDNAAMTTNPVTVLSATNSTGGVLNVSNIGTVTLSGFVPAGKYLRLVTANTSGTPTFLFRNGQETLF